MYSQDGQIHHSLRQKNASILKLVSWLFALSCIQAATLISFLKFPFSSHLAWLLVAMCSTIPSYQDFIQSARNQKSDLAQCHRKSVTITLPYTPPIFIQSSFLFIHPSITLCIFKQRESVLKYLNTKRFKLI